MYIDEKKSDLDLMLNLYSSESGMDEELKLHCKRVGYYSYVVARAMGMSEKLSEEIMYGALLHDIGKTKTPPEILNKASKLTEEEFGIMKEHCEEGFKIISEVNPQSNSNFKNILLNISYHHHEKWDGKGYPIGLKGKEIPIEANIVTIADVFDALTAERCYKKAWTLEATTVFINKQSGSIFNPEVVQSFNKLKHVFEEIKNYCSIDNKSQIDNPALYKKELMDFLHSRDIDLPFEEKVSKENKCSNFLSSIMPTSPMVSENNLASAFKR